ncbi:crossover junction endodeoxyribonuclease RuvC [Thermopirellula anaerolimosa]
MARTSDGQYRIVGVDPGLNVTGYAVIESSPEGLRFCEAGVVRGGNRGLGPRLAALYAGLRELIETYHPRVMALEELYSHYERPRTAILMGHARGVICLAAAQADVEIVSYAATQIKRLLTGSGRAPKNQVQRAIQRELGLPAPPEPPDVADALAIAICHHYLRTKTEWLQTAGLSHHLPGKR